MRALPWLSLVILLWAVPTRGQDSQGVVPNPSDFENAEGWTWRITPLSTLVGSTGQAEVVYVHIGVVEGGREWALAYKPEPLHRYRIVAFDEQRNRYEAHWSLGAGVADFSLLKYRLDPWILDPEQVAYVGFEELSPEGWRAFSEATQHESNLQMLPFPALDEPFEFSLTSMDGASLRSADLKGRVVAIDAWATWCTPCMAKMPEQKAAYERWHTEGLEIIGINLDFDRDEAESAIRKEGFTWPQVYVPSDDESRATWYDVSTIQSVPRLYVIDREGILRLDTQRGDEFQEMISNLMEAR